MGKSGKGSDFERTISRVLSRWWTEGTRDDVFWRSVTSGGWAHIRRKAGKTSFGQSGDLQALDPIGQPLIDFFAIELKRGYGLWDFLELLDGNGDRDKLPLALFWSQAKEQSLGRLPLLIVRRDRHRAVVIFPREFLSLLATVIYPPRAMSPKIILEGLDDDGPLVAVPLDLFLETVTPKSVVELVSRKTATPTPRRRRGV